MSNLPMIFPSSTSFVEQKNINTLIDTTRYYGRTKELINLLLDVNVIILNPNNTLDFHGFVKDRRDVRSIEIAKALGFIAESIVVRECNNNLNKNRTWANIARSLKILESHPLLKMVHPVLYQPFLENPDDYVAIRTGSTVITERFGDRYSRTGKQDICWVNKNDNLKELLIVGKSYNDQKKAAIQLKSSCDNSGIYVTRHFKETSVFRLYPVVYFDLGNDFHKVRDNLINISKKDKFNRYSLFGEFANYGDLSRSDLVDIMLVQGRTVDEDLHEELLYYKHILEEIRTGKISLSDLKDEKIIEYLIYKYLQRNIIPARRIYITPVLTIPVE